MIRTRQGQVMYKEQDMSGYVTEANKAGLTVETGGKRIKDLLTSIGKVSDNLTGVQSKLSTQRVLLKQLVLAGLIATEYDSAHQGTAPHATNKKPTASAKQQSPVSVSVSLVTANLGSRLQHTIVARLTNHCVVALSDMWSFTTTVTNHMPYNQHDMKENHQQWHTAQCVAIRNLEQNAFQEIHISLPESAMNKLPLVVKPVLTLYLPENVIQRQSTTLPLPLPSSVIDTLTMLIPEQPMRVSQSVPSTLSQLTLLAHRRPGAKLGDTDLRPSPPAIGHYSCNVHVRPNCIKPIITQHTGNC